MDIAAEGALLSRHQIEAAHDRVRGAAHRTPVMTSSTFDRLCGAEVHFKCENLQRVGAFKIRGAVNTVNQLDADELARGVVTHSSGNHAQALCLAARLVGCRATIVMPKTASAVKLEAVRGYGGEVVKCEPRLESRMRTVEEIVRATDAVLVHPYDDLRVIAGQATAAKELIEDVARLDLILVPIGGGGLASGTTLAALHFSPTTAVVAVEPAGADDAYRSLAADSIQPSIAPKSVADGLLSRLGEHPFAILRNRLKEIVLVDDDAIVAAMRWMWERMKIVVEPSAAVPVAAVMDGRIDVTGRRVGIILTGGNVDLSRLPWNRSPGTGDHLH